MAINLESIQTTIGYEFNNTDLLQQAFVRRSYSEEHGGQNNEVLEFIGDKALDLAVIRIMMEEFGQITEDKEYKEFKLRNPKYFQTKYSEGKFTDIKKDLVQKRALAKSMDRLGFHNQLIMGKGDMSQNIHNQDSVKEDLFEAIIGAVAVDCDWDMDTITQVVATMIDFDSYFEQSEDSNENYVGKVQEWTQKNQYELPRYIYHEFDDRYECQILIDEIDLNQFGKGISKAKARMDAARQAYKVLLEDGYIINVFKEAVGEANPYESLRQINELVQKGLISKPKYDFEQEYDEDGNAIWTCTCSIENIDESFVNTESSKKEAQRKSAYEILLYLMDEYEENQDELKIL